MIHYSDPKYSELGVRVEDWVKRATQALPIVLIKQLGEGSLKLEGSPKGRECPNCGNIVIQQGTSPSPSWRCSCDTFIDQFLHDEHYTELKLAAIEGIWPGTGDFIYWFNDEIKDERGYPNPIVDAATSCGFYVYTSPAYPGYLLALSNTNRSDVIFDYWAPLYIKLGIGTVEGAHTIGFRIKEPDALENVEKALRASGKLRTFLDSL